ncbi:MAG TPA: protoporphyrinogen oxidase, partial [Planctomycetota bacterium]|nr:protoporphyrinogen oxidase [Planctomycetota bacterium]
MRPARVVVAGGGVAGLAVAHHLRTLSPDRAPEVILLEAADRAGGKVRTDSDGNCIRERGPNGFLDDARGTVELVHALGLEKRLRRASARSARRFVFRGPGLWRVPSTRAEFLFSRLLSFRAKLRVMFEPFAREAPEGDESVYDFARRRLGEEPARVLADAFVAGVFAGDARALSVYSAFPTLRTMEAEHGSLLRGMKARAGARGTLTTFDGGMQVLTDALASRLGGAVRTGRRAMGLERRGNGWAGQAADGEVFAADAVVCALPAADAAFLLGRREPRWRAALEGIPTVPVAVVSLRYREEDAPRAREGYGFLVPSGERPRVLGVLWESTIFEGTAPPGEVLLRAMVGGARAPEVVDRSDDDIVRLVR